MKRTVWILVYSVIIFGFTACGSSSSPEKSQALIDELKASIKSNSTTPTSVQTYKLTTEVIPEGAGSIAPDEGVYNAGEEVTITATSFEGYAFSSWSGNYTGDNPEIKIVMDSDKTITANFTDIAPANFYRIYLSEITYTSANITWKTSEETISEIRYGLTKDYEFVYSENGTSDNYHSIILSGLIPGATYYCRILATDRGGNISISKEFTFTTNITPEYVSSKILSAAVLGRSLYNIDYSITNNSSQIITVSRVEIRDELGLIRHVVSESTIYEIASEGRLLPGCTYRWHEDFFPPMLATDIHKWNIKWYCLGSYLDAFIVTSSFDDSRYWLPP